MVQGTLTFFRVGLLVIVVLFLVAEDARVVNVAGGVERERVVVEAGVVTNARLVLAKCGTQLAQFTVVVHPHICRLIIAKAAILVLCPRLDSSC